MGGPLVRCAQRLITISKCMRRVGCLMMCYQGHAPRFARGFLGMRAPTWLRHTGATCRVRRSGVKGEMGGYLWRGRRYRHGLLRACS